MNVKKRFTAKILSIALIFSLCVPSHDNAKAEGVTDTIFETAVIWAPTAAAALAFSIVSGSMYYFLPKNKKLSDQEIRILGMHFSHELVRVATALLVGSVAGFVAYQGAGFALAEKINSINIASAETSSTRLIEDMRENAVIMGFIKNDEGLWVCDEENTSSKYFFLDVFSKDVNRARSLLNKDEFDFSANVGQIRSLFLKHGINTEVKIEQFYRGMQEGYKEILRNLLQRKKSLEFSNKYVWGLLGKSVNTSNIDTQIESINNMIEKTSIIYSGAEQQRSGFLENLLGSYIKQVGAFVSAGFAMKKLEAQLSQKSPYSKKLDEMGRVLDSISVIISSDIVCRDMVDKDKMKKILNEIIEECEGVSYSVPEKQRADFLKSEALSMLKILYSVPSAA